MCENVSVTHSSNNSKAFEMKLGNYIKNRYGVILNLVKIASLQRAVESESSVS